MFLNPHSTAYGVYVSQLIRFEQVSGRVDGFTIRNKVFFGQNFSGKATDFREAFS